MTTNDTPLSAYPLTWPIGQPRTTRRQEARFKVMMLGLEYAGYLGHRGRFENDTAARSKLDA